MITYQNYHKHTYYTNLRISDSIVSYEDYAKRAVELGHGILASGEHGWQGKYIECYEIAKQYGLKFVESTEAYWVKDRFAKDKSNCHIIIAALNENGRQALNDVLAEANISGFYTQPRLDIELLMKLPPNDVIVTSACVAGWRYEDADDIWLQLSRHFKHFYLEVQYHNTDKQRALNRRILELHNHYDIPLIMGCDSHYIQDGEQERTDYLASKGMHYEDEESWYLDYPDGDTAYRRFADQCVLSHDEIMEAINNTNIFLEVEEYDCPIFNHEVKMPTLYPDKTQEERNQIYLDLINEKWQQEKPHISPDKWDVYEQEIKKETDTVIATDHADYFLLDYYAVEKGKQKGGVLTATGRGSGVSFYTNYLLGFTKVDRIAANVKMYPERFMSTTRILASHNLADIDMNCADTTPFIDAQSEIIGAEHAYPMLAYGTMKPKAAWKMYAKSQDVPFEISNEISKQLERYEKAIKEAREADEDFDVNEIDPTDYIDAEFVDIFEKSKSYRQVVTSASIHPCSHLVYMGNIRREIGLMRIKDNLCCLMDGHWAEDYKFLKNDWLTVTVVKIIDEVYKRIGIPWHTVTQLIQACPPHSPVWDIYKNGALVSINQCSRNGTKQRVMKYAPQNISELCAFVAAIRPGFKSMYKIFEQRKHFDYGIPSLDELIQTKEMPNSFILYQEMSMAVLNYAGIPMDECYNIIKNIAKKRVEKVLAYKEQFLSGMKHKLIENEHSTEARANQTANKIWEILEDSSRYSFNASHSYCVALDSLYGAYLKCNYPVQYYAALMQIYEERGDKDKALEAREEAENYFKIVFPPYRFGRGGTTIDYDVNKNTITYPLTAVKGYGKTVCNTLYECSKAVTNGDFVDVLNWLDAHSIKSAKISPLVKLDYFQEFGNINELERFIAIYDLLKQGTAKSIAPDEIERETNFDWDSYLNKYKKDGTERTRYEIQDTQALLHQYWKHIKSLGLQEPSIRDKIILQQDVMGTTNLTTGRNEDRKKIMVTAIYPLTSAYSPQPWAYTINTRSIGTGKTARLTVRANIFNQTPLKQYDVVLVSEGGCYLDKKGYWNLTSYSKVEV